MSDFAAVVRANWKTTQGFVVAGEPPCIEIGRDEVKNVRRRLAFVRLADAPTLEPTGSWFMAVIVCPGDDLTALAAWARDKDVRRVYFYLHADADGPVLTPWQAAGLPTDRVDAGFRSWGPLHKVMGLDLNRQVFEDHA